MEPRLGTKGPFPQADSVPVKGVRRGTRAPRRGAPRWGHWGVPEEPLQSCSCSVTRSVAIQADVTMPWPFICLPGSSTRGGLGAETVEESRAGARPCYTNHVTWGRVPRFSPSKACGGSEILYVMHLRTLGIG